MDNILHAQNYFPSFLGNMHWDALSPLSATALLGHNIVHSHALDCSPKGIASLLPVTSNASVNFAYPLPANSTFEVPAGDTGYPTNPVGLPALCAVSVQVQTPGNSSFGFGLFLPNEWSGRFLYVLS
jgi:feruloyl esterase